MRQQAVMAFASGCLIAAAALNFSAPSHAQSWPTKPIRILVPHAPGGVTDVITRIVAQPLQDALGQPIIVENRPGASGLLGTEVAARAAPDGYTLLMYVDTNTIFPSTVKQLSHDPDTSFVPITLLARGSHVVVAHPSLPVSNLQELVRYAKANPGQLSYATPGAGSPQHLAGETIKQETGIDIAHIPYKGGGQAIGDVVGGQVKLGVLGMAPVMPHYKVGKLKILAVTGEQRSLLLPEIPTVAESGLPGFATLQWTGIVAPAGTSPAIVARVHAAMVDVLRQPGVVEKIAALGQEVKASASPEDFRQMIRAEIKRWPAVVSAAGVKPE
ncbi:MAG TPA: tripartite tricarboxylate transporter substrate binding protein [Casimicrobiaceae bacterium]|nr:tripartite tricarboxylate transporter substrate binding protein [Casimicrobiaceae bacterium]